MKEFAFLYPIPEYIDFEISNHEWHEQGFKNRYGHALNQCIDLRYRQNGFEINYVIFDKHPISDVINIQASDKIIEAGIDYKTHTTKRVDGTYLYPDPDYILDQLPKLKTLTISGFHLWDCVERLAERAHERGLNVLVDEDLTELFAGRLNDPDFRIDRKGEPWFWQNY